MDDGTDGGRNSGFATVRVWDRPTRIFHWTLVVLFVVCFLSGRQGRFDIHIPAGQTLLVLIAARIVWGLVGSETSRFRSLVRPPRGVFGYMATLGRRVPDGNAGHNPLGGLSVVVMLMALAGQAVLGLFSADTDGLHEGPLSFIVSYATARQASELHALVVDALIVLIGLHVAAVLFHLVWKRENLVGPMLSGRKKLPRAQASPRLVPDGRALLVLAATAGVILGAIEAARLLL